MMRRLSNLALRILMRPMDPLLRRIAMGVAPINKPDWTAEEQQALLHFLRSPAGLRLLLILRANDATLKSAACDVEQRRVDHARGRATGYYEAIASLIVLSAPPASAEDNTAADSKRDVEAELRDQLSPN